MSSKAQDRVFTQWRRYDDTSLRANYAELVHRALRGEFPSKPRGHDFMIDPDFASSPLDGPF